MSKSIHEGWHLIADANEIIEGMPTVLRRFGESLVLWRDPTGTVRAELDACPHRDEPLLRLDEGEPCLECLAHAPAPTPLVREAHGWIWMWRGALHPQPAPPDYFAGLGSHLGYSTSQALRVRSEEPDDATHLRLDASDPRRGRVTATVPVDDRQAVVYQRAYRPGARTLLHRALDALDEALGRRRLRGISAG